jgi:hypothetical protein
MRIKKRLSLVAVVTVLIILSGVQQARSQTQTQDFVASVPINHAHVSLSCGGDLQAVINAAIGPTLITVAHLQKDGKTRCNWGSYALPWRNDNAIVTIATDGTIPADGKRTQAGDSYLALFTANCATGQGYYQVFFPAGTAPTNTAGHPPHGYAFAGLEITAPNDTACASYGLVTLGAYTTGTVTSADLPSQFTFSHCYIHGANADQEIGRGISMVGNNLTVTDSTISEIHSTFIESNTIYGCTMVGNWTIENNDLQAAGETLFVCGSEGQMAMASPGNFSIRYNWIHKNPAWRNYVSKSGSPYIMKNLLEFKSMNGAVIDSNVFEYSWNESQEGYAIVFTPRYLGDGLHTVKNISVTNNIIRHVAMGVVIGLYDDSTCPAVHPYNTCLEAGGGSENFTFRNNLVDDLSGDHWGDGGSSYAFLLTTITAPGATRPFTPGVVIDHNTIVSGGANINSCDLYYSVVGGAWPPAKAATSVQVTYNIFPFATCRDGATGPTAILPGTQFNHNSMAISFNPQAAWDTTFPGKSNLASSTANPDGRGANLQQLQSLETMVKSGRRPASSNSVGIPR